jgi:hypothetical protein
MALWIQMVDMADAYDAASIDLLEGAAIEIILALVEADAAITPERRAGLIAVGALMLRLGRDAGVDRQEATTRLLKRLGITPDDKLSPGNT